jgi:hypothetical protein
MHHGEVLARSGQTERAGRSAAGRGEHDDAFALPVPLHNGDAEPRAKRFDIGRRRLRTERELHAVLLVPW